MRIKKLKITELISKIILTIVYVMLPFSASAEGPRPYITSYVVGDDIKVENNGSCPIYRVEIYTIPPDKGDLSSVWSRLTASTVGAGSYSYTIGTIKENQYELIPIHRLVNSSGERLNLSRVRVGDFVIDMNYCGYSKQVSWKP